MKKTLTIILLSISLSGFSQTGKGDWAITPTVGWNTVKVGRTTSDYDYFGIKFPVSFHKYLRDRFALGFVTTIEHGRYKPLVANQIYTSIWRIYLEPEARYNILKNRFTPFVAGRIIDVGYSTQFSDNPTTPVEFRRISNVYLETSIQIDIGVSYFIKDRFGLQVKLMGVNTWDFKDINANFYTPINFGLQFIINNPRSEIESPR